MKSISRLKRAAALVGVGALAIGGAVLGSQQAFAAVGTQLGALSLTPGTGNTSGTAITYNSTACPNGFNTSGIVRIVDPTTGAVSNLSVVNSGVSAAFTGSLVTNVFSTIIANNPNFADLATNGTEAEIAVLCASGPSLTGSVEYVQDSYVVFGGAGTTFTETNTPPVGPPAAVTLGTPVANPSPATSGQQVTVTVPVTPTNATGSVQITNNGTVLGSATLPGPTPGTATISFTAPTETAATTVTLTATYLPTGNFTAVGPTTVNLTVNPPAPNSGTIPLAVVVPQSGTFTLTVDTADYVVLNVNAAGTQGTATTTPIVVSDTRNFYPGWSVSGQATKWQGVTAAPATGNGFPTIPANTPADHASQTMAADDLGWAPGNTGTLAQGVQLGGTVAPNTTTNGLGDAAQVLASVHAGTGNGFGTTTLNAALTLDIPAGQEAGAYASGLNITSVNALP